MSIKNELRINWHHLDIDPDNPKDVLDILWDALSPGIIVNMEAELNVVLIAAREKEESENEKSIRAITEQLPEGNKLKEAIDGVEGVSG